MPHVWVQIDTDPEGLGYIPPDKLMTQLMEWMATAELGDTIQFARVKYEKDAEGRTVVLFHKGQIEAMQKDMREKEKSDD